MGFSSIIGHDRQKTFLLSLLAHDRLPHAFLFSGQEGIGKRKAAIEFVKHILCDEGTGCDKCRPCLKIEHKTHPDLLIVEGELSGGPDPSKTSDEETDTGGRDRRKALSISQSKMIIKEVSEHPYEGEKRAIIIDGAHTMTREASNALLKTLEEPPPFNIFFLITSSERDVPLTIRSRCARVAFSPLGQDDVENYLMRVMKMDSEKARLIARQSYGSIGLGLFWAEKDNLLLRRKLAELILGKKKSFLATTAVAERVSKSDRGLSLYLSFLLSFFRDLYLVSQEKGRAPIMNIDLKDLIEGEALDPRWIGGSLKKIQETIFNMRYNVNKWLLFENLMLHITR